jgi:hypothetical protein
MGLHQSRHHPRLREVYDFGISRDFDVCADLDNFSGLDWLAYRDTSGTHNSRTDPRRTELDRIGRRSAEEFEDWLVQKADARKVSREVVPPEFRTLLGGWLE